MDQFVDANDDLFLLTYSNNILTVHKINRDGYKLWSVTITNNTKSDILASTRYYFNPSIVSDNNGGVIVVWIDHRNSISILNYPYYANNEIRAQKIDQLGTTLWSTDGIVVKDTSRGLKYLENISDYDYKQYDGHGGIYLIWSLDPSQNPEFRFRYYLQHIHENATIDFPEEGKLIAESIPNPGYPVAPITMGVWGGFIGRNTLNNNIYLLFKYESYASESDSYNKLLIVDENGDTNTSYKVDYNSWLYIRNNTIWLRKWMSTNYEDSMYLAQYGEYPNIFSDTLFIFSKNSFNGFGFANTDESGKDYWFFDRSNIVHYVSTTGITFNYKINSVKNIVRITKTKNSYMLFDDLCSSCTKADYSFKTVWPKPITFLKSTYTGQVEQCGQLADHRGGVFVIFWNFGDNSVRIQHITPAGNIGITSAINTNISDYPLNINVFPNPCNDEKIYFDIRTLNNIKINIRLYDNLGREVTVRDNIVSDGESILFLDIRNFKSGAYRYIIKNNSGDIVSMGKFIKI